MILVLHSSSALVVYHGSDFAHDFVLLLKKSFSFSFNCQIGTNTKSAMEKEPWIKQSPNPSGFKTIGLFCLILVKIEINHFGEETEVTGSILAFREIDRNVLWHI